jgi:DNA-binding MarR family transcriptional regulator
MFRIPAGNCRLTGARLPANIYSNLNYSLINQSDGSLDALIGNAYRALHVLRHELVSLPGQQLMHHHLAILTMLEQGGSLTATVIAKSLSLTKPQTTSFIDHLVDEKAVTREIDLADRRRIIISLTPAGLAILGKYRAVVRESMRKKFSRLTQAELETLSGALTSINSLANKLD